MIYPKIYDVGVVGGGPAGSSAAKVLAQAGLSVAILEKTKWPRYKTCGGGLIERSRRLSGLSLGNVVEQRCYETQLHHHGPRLNFSTQRSDPVVEMVMRENFDQVLIDEAVACGATFWPETPVNDIKISARDVVLSTGAGEFRVRYLIGADGVGSTVAKRLGFADLSQVAPAFECEVTVDEDDYRRFSKAARFDFGLTPYGYGWVFPKAARLSIGVLTTRKGSCNLNTEYLRYRAALGIHKVMTEEKHGYMIPLKPRKNLFSQPRVLLVGDAAGLADPVTAEGISAAIWSGQLAGASIARGFPDAGNVQAFYRMSLNHALLRELAAARVFAKVLYNFPRVRGYIFKRHGEKLTQFMTDVVMGRARYRDALLRPRLYAQLLFGRSRQGLVTK